MKEKQCKKKIDYKTIKYIFLLNKMSATTEPIISKNKIHTFINTEEYVKEAYENPGEIFSNCKIELIEPNSQNYIPCIQRTPSYCSVSKKINNRTIEIDIAFYGGRLFASLAQENIKSQLNNIENEQEIVPYLIHILEDYKPTISQYRYSQVVNSILNLRIL
jgi:hypothetical protein